MSDSISNNLIYIKQKQELLNTVKNGIFYDSVNSLFGKDNILIPDIVHSSYSETFDKNSFLTEDFAIFCQYAFMKCKDSYSPDIISNDYINNNNICFLNNIFSEKAYSVFSAYLPQCSKTPLFSFKDIIEEINLGQCKYAILPILNSDEGHLSSFRNMIVSNDLKITYETDIFTDNESYTRFVLVQKNLVIPHEDKNNLKIVLSIIISNDETIAGLINAFSYYNISILSVNSFFDNITDKNLYYFELSVDSLAGKNLLFFLECSHSRYNILGYYYHI